MVQDRATITKSYIEWRNFHELERPQTQILRSRHFLKLTISETVLDTDIDIRITNIDLYILLKGRVQLRSALGSILIFGNDP